MQIEMENVINFYHQLGTYACFSNFYPVTFKDDNGNIYYNSEQYFMKKKQERFDPNNINLANKIMSSKNPYDIKCLGRQVKNFNEKIWNECRYDIMKEALFLKFSQNKDICKILLNTGNSYLVENSPTDYVWGCGKDNTGMNLLGHALMDIRKKINN